MTMPKRDKNGRFLPSAKTKAKAKKVEGYKPPKVKVPLTTLVAYLIDGSNSMNEGERREQVISGFNEYINTLKQDKNNTNTLFSCTIFSTGAYRDQIILSRINVVQPIRNVISLDRSTYRPDGWTPLYDAIGDTILHTDEVIRSRNLKVDRIVMIIHTDGEENKSQKFNKNEITQMIRNKENTGYWTFTYMGVDANAWASAKSIGIPQQNYLHYDPTHTDRAFKSAATATMAYAASPQLKSNVFFQSGTKVVNGQIVKAKHIHEHLSKSQRGKTWETTEWEDGTWSCNCTGWINHKYCGHIGGGTSALPGKIAVEDRYQGKTKSRGVKVIN